jgi:hypothetical protein
MEKVINKQMQPWSGIVYTWYMSSLWTYVMQALNKVTQEVIILTNKWKVTISNLHSDTKHDREFFNFS